MNDDPSKHDAQPQLTGVRLLLSVYPSIALPMFLAVVDQTIVSTALPAIAGALGGVERVSWVVVAYLVATTVAAPVYGRLRDVYGGKRMMFIALGIFIAASILCASARSIEMLAVARIVQGLGGGGLMTLSQALIGETVPPRERARYQGYLAAIIVTSSTFGPVAGGYLTQHFGWRSVFLINLPLGLLAGLLALRLASRPLRTEPWTFDIVGLALLIAFIAPVLLALEQARHFNANVLPLFLALMAIGIAALVLLIRREKSADFPLLPMDLLQRPSIWRSDALAACHGAVLVSLVTFLPIYLRVAHGASASETGLYLLPMMFGIGTGSLATGRIVSITGRTAIMPSIGLVLATIMLLGFAIWSPRFSTRELAWFLFVNGLFMGTVMGVVNVTVQRAAGATSLGSGAASVQLSRSMGAAIGTALVGSVLFATLALSDPEAARLFATLIEKGQAATPAMPAARHAAIQAEIANAFRAAFLTIAAFAAVGAALAWSIPARRL